MVEILVYLCCVSRGDGRQSKGLRLVKCRQESEDVILQQLALKEQATTELPPHLVWASTLNNRILLAFCLPEVGPRISHDVLPRGSWNKQMPSDTSTL